MRRFPLVVCSILLLGLVASGLWATRATKQQEAEQIVNTAIPGTVPSMTMKDMALRSAKIVSGRCLQTRSTWINRTLYTLATINVDETIKGDESPTLMVAIPGGADATRRIAVAMTYPGAPVIQRQEEVFLFLQPAELIPGSYSVMGYAQGKLSIVEDENSEKLVTRSPAMTQTYKPNGKVRGARLAEFKEQIRGYLR